MKRKMVILILLVSFFDGYANSVPLSTMNDLNAESKLENNKDYQTNKITGTVLDAQGMPLPGVNVIVQGTVKGTQTDFDGQFNINAEKGDVLVFSYVGYKSQSVKVGDFKNVNITMAEDATGLDEVVIVGYDTQTKEALVGSITQVKPSELKIPSSNLTSALAGRVAGLISFQNSGEPGQNNAEFFIRGATTFGIRSAPLILIDGIELSANDLARLNPDDIDSFSIFKDATATAIYGARGANGVISVVTKSGEEGKAKVSVRYESSYSQATQNINLADPITYLRLHNEAVSTRSNFGGQAYPLNKLANTLLENRNENVYPTVNWQDELLEDFTNNQRLNFNVAGGGKVARYYVAGGFSQDNGILKVDDRNNYNNNIDLKTFYLRSNINIDLTPTTEAVIRLNATIDDYRGPIPSGTEVYNMINRSNPVRFPAYYEPDAANATTEHILFGNDDGGVEGSANFINPYAELIRGYRETGRTLNLVQLEVKQDLESVLPGLRWRFLGNYNRTSTFSLERSSNPYYYQIGLYNPVADTYSLSQLQQGTEFLSYQDTSDDRIVNSIFYMETALNYNQTFKEKHNISALFVGIMREFVDGNASTLQLSLPSRNIGVSGRVTYNYDKRYFIEGNFGYNGSERFAQNNRFGFFPSVGAGWVISNEKFWKFDAINRLKLRGSYGVVGNDDIGDRANRYFYLSTVNLNDIGNGAVFGTNFSQFLPGVSISNYENPFITWEKAYKQNYGLEVNMFKDAIQLQAEYFAERRTDILQERADIPTILGLQSDIFANIGEAKSNGFEISLDINHQFNKDFSIAFTGNYVDTKSEFVVFEEPDYSQTSAPWLSRQGQPINQAWGLIAERLFVDEADVLNSPVQQFGEVMAGDIKYRDVNGDGTITNLDRVPIGESTQPEISYGFGFTLAYKNFDFSAFFQGLDRFSFFINSEKLTPFADTDVFTGNNADYLPGRTAENQILQEFADSYWSETNQDIYALWPRLSTIAIDNNNQQSTWWMRDGAFIRLKQIEIGYNFEAKKGGPFGQAAVRMYINANNLVHWSKFKLWDPELRGNGLNYPLQRVVNVGLRVNL